MRTLQPDRLPAIQIEENFETKEAFPNTKRLFSPISKRSALHRYVGQMTPFTFVSHANRVSGLDEIRLDLQVVDSEHRVTHREDLLGIHEAWVVED